MIPVLLWILSPHFPWQAYGAQEILASVLFVMASITDGLDGYLARRRGQITTMGMLLALWRVSSQHAYSYGSDLSFRLGQD